MARRPSSRKSSPEAALDRVADHLTVICGFGELLRDGVYGRLTPKQHRVLKTMAQQAREAALWFQDILERERRKPRPRSSP